MVSSVLVGALVLPLSDPVPPQSAGTSIVATGSALSVAPNFVLILTDDQRADTLWAMPKVRRHLVRHGVTFRNGIITDPLCCPSRASILTGRFAHGTRVWSNSANRRGAWRAFAAGGNEERTIAIALQSEGYRTALLGKYLNGYKASTGGVPPGWDRWFVFNGGQGRYYDYQMVDVQSAGDPVSITDYGSGVGDYSTDVIADEAVRFVEETPPDRPFFLFASVFAPHGALPGPPIPAPRHRTAFKQKVWRHPPSFNEADVRDKPRYIRGMPRSTAGSVRDEERKMRHRAASLLAVDDLVGRIFRTLENTNRLATTMIAFVSDNGFLQREHRWNYKVVPYEESIRVPFLIRYDPLTERRKTDALVSNVDLAPTFADLAGIGFPGSQGVSFRRVLSGGRKTRSSVLLESMRYPSGNRPTVPSYCGLRTKNRVFVRYASGFEELYNLRKDPHQLINAAERNASAVRVMRRATRSLCRPTPPGFRWRARS